VQLFQQPCTDRVIPNGIEFIWVSSRVVRVAITISDADGSHLDSENSSSDGSDEAVT